MLVVLAAVLPLASDGREDRWQWMLILVVGAALLAGGLAVAAPALLLRSVPDSRDELTKLSRKVDRISVRLDELDAGRPAGPRGDVDRAFAETRDA